VSKGTRKRRNEEDEGGDSSRKRAKTKRTENPKRVSFPITLRNRRCDGFSQKLKGEGGESHSKGAPLGNSDLEPEAGKKRKKEDLENSPSKRSRVGNRGNTRVKEQPAGNAATSSARKAFLRSLCASPNFLSLVDLVPAVVSGFFF
jgi:hypothetical protein